MSHAIEDSNKIAKLVGGCIYPEEEGTITIPPEQAKDFTPTIEALEEGQEMEVTAKDCEAIEVLKEPQIAELLKARNEKRPWKNREKTKTGKEI